MKWIVFFIALLTSGCGYRVMTWDLGDFQTIHIRQIRTSQNHLPSVALFQQALNDRCLALSGLLLVDEGQADLILESTLHSLVETIIATDTDRRIRQVQFTMLASFKLLTQEGKVLWKVDKFRFSDQYEVSTTRDAYKNDAASSLNKAYLNISETVVTHFSIALNQKREKDD